MLAIPTEALKRARVLFEARVRRTPTCWHWKGRLAAGAPVLRLKWAGRAHDLSARRLARILGGESDYGARHTAHCGNDRCVRPHRDHVAAGVSTAFRKRQSVREIERRARLADAPPAAE